MCGQCMITKLATIKYQLTYLMHTNACLAFCISFIQLYGSYTSFTCVRLTPSAVVIDAYPNTTMVLQGTTLVLVCRVVGVPSTTVLRYNWTCPGGCDAGAVDPEWAARVEQGNILVVNVRTQEDDNGAYNCTVAGGDLDNTQQVGTATYTLTVASEFSDYNYYASTTCMWYYNYYNKMMCKVKK